ncbi:MAG: hypothetical protein ABSG17_24280 [Spirochaetia bacterium]|jgi:uncharacterized membrane protein YeaQ/YmgE (transglycosylase-associated protein family)
MSRLSKVVCLTVIVFLAAGAIFAQQTQAPRSSTSAIILTLLLGFGSGQYYLGDNGVGFLLGDAIGVVGVGVGYAVFASSFVGYYRYQTSTFDEGLALVAGGAIVLLVTRIWEIVDIFGRVEKGRQEGTVVEMEPVIDVRNTSFEAGVSIHH